MHNVLNFWHHTFFFFNFPCYDDLLSYAVNVLGFKAYNDLVEVVPLNHTHNPLQTKPEVVAATCKKKKKIRLYRTLLSKSTSVAIIVLICFVILPRLKPNVGKEFC